MQSEQNQTSEPLINCNNEIEKKDVWWREPDIVVPIISLILAPIFSFTVAFFVVNLQLSKEHSFSEAQQRSLREQIKIDQKVQLHTKAIKLIGTTSSSRLGIAVTHLYASVELSYLLDGLEEYRDTYNQSAKQFSDLLLEEQKSFSELRATLETARYYFGIETQDAINEFFSFYSTNSTISIPNTQKIMEDFKRAKENGVSDVSIVAGLEKKLTQIVNSDNYIKIGNKVTNAMMIEIASDLKLVMLNKDQIYQHNKAISADAKRRAAE